MIFAIVISIASLLIAAFSLRAWYETATILIGVGAIALVGAIGGVVFLTVFLAPRIRSLWLRSKTWWKSRGMVLPKPKRA